eukprot:CAMPEP_0175958526 /NCGR_PEP_ID=MMETSP0108-20121206/34296_1 /TAXON_ID=195067 ORGANISM="Goniomonas pacifica, Strain CCMP1869" /NCGR_SAMPLE_ID=MMETSP0108 /ASSEMBLY_ACC=CAM_ASM_000204 /LENGTH=224 /DNA_ID=CAMNT_0017285889 /DNA_START=88 /DNA_END=761 /DNA_ORIENTATION=-
MVVEGPFAWSTSRWRRTNAEVSKPMLQMTPRMWSMVPAQDILFGAQPVTAGMERLSPWFVPSVSSTSASGTGILRTMLAADKDMRPTKPPPPVDGPKQPAAEKKKKTMKLVEVMKKKQKAKGDQKVEVSTRVYMDVWVMSPSGTPVYCDMFFFNQHWLVSRAVQSVLAATGHTIGNPRLYLGSSGAPLAHDTALHRLGKVFVSGDAVVVGEDGLSPGQTTLPDI